MRNECPIQSEYDDTIISIAAATIMMMPSSAIYQRFRHMSQHWTVIMAAVNVPKVPL